MAQLIKIGTPTITRPNEEGQIIRETPKMLIVGNIRRTFESKTSGTGVTHKFTKGEREWFGNNTKEIRRFWKDTGKEVGGDSFIRDSFININRI